MKKEEIIEIIKTCQWAITVFGIWCLLFIFGVMWLDYSVKKSTLFDIATSKYSDLEHKFNHHAHFFQDGKATYIK